MKNFKEESFVEDFSTLPMSIISYSDDPDERLETLNSLILECTERHEPVKKDTCYQATSALDEISQH